MASDEDLVSQISSPEDPTSQYNPEKLTKFPVSGL